MVEMAGRRTVLLGLTAILSATVAGCKIIPIAEHNAADADAFDATAFARDLWAEKALPHFISAARPLPEVLAAVAANLDTAGAQYGYRAAAEGSAWTFIVTGTGTVTAKNTESRAGTLAIALAGTVPPTEIAVQIGPVIRGNAVRDSLPFVSFKDFTNQLEFADVGKALTALALEAVSADATAIEVGESVSFTGAMSLNSKTDRIIVTPVSLKASGA